MLDTDIQLEVTQVLSCCYSHQNIVTETKYKNEEKEMSMRGSIKFCQSPGSNSDNVFFFFLMRSKGIQIAIGHHRPAGETPLNGVSLAGR